MTDTKIFPVTGDVHWVGVMDKELRTFDVIMHTPYGSTYNSYFINATKKTIVETVKLEFLDVFVEKLKKFCDPADIEYIVVNHTEPDHSGSLKKMLELSPKAKVVGSGNAIRYLKDQLGMEFPHIILKDGDVLDLGNKTLRVIGAPNLHWPDSIYTYLEEDKVLFTCDSFGAHYCHENMYDDEVGNWDEAFKYYFDVILKPFSKFMLKAIEKIRPLDIAAICTGHGPILRSDWKRYVDLSEQYAKDYLAQLPQEPTVFIPYVSAYHNTEKLARYIAEGIKQIPGVKIELHDIEKMPAEQIDQYLTQATGILVGTPTFNQNILPPIYTLFSLISPLRDKGKLAGGFGSYGWSGEGKTIVQSAFTNLKLKYFGEGMFIKFTPHEHDKETYMEYGQKFAQQLVSEFKSE